MVLFVSCAIFWDCQCFEMLVISCAVVLITCVGIGMGFCGIGNGAGMYCRYMSGKMMRAA